ncbi:MAG: polysaccharide biosynthesis protein [Candidatus Pelagibacter sp.]|nr:polysaccharide biosynthesis protein [Candidatus Pelagibacter sp.]|tara:strand:- start:2105 stop:4030 length:1926 start_codon:yes stop_codon:yes gene_type:complete
MQLKKALLSTSRVTKKLLVLSSDFISICLAILLALVVSNVSLQSLNLEEYLRLAPMPLICIAAFWFFGVYSSVVRYIDLSVILVLVKAIVISFLLGLIGNLLYIYLLGYFIIITSDSLLSLEGWLVGFITFSFLIVSSRLTAHFYLSDRISEKRVVIYGAGSAGIQLASALRVSKEMQPIAFIDSNISLHGTYLGGIKVLHPKKLKRLSLSGKVDEVLIAIPSASRSILRDLLKEIQEYSVKVRILPGLAEIAQGKVLVSELKEVDITDLLGRYEVEANQGLIDKNIRDKTVLITGAGGSIGSEIARQVSKNNPKTLIILDANEFALYEIKNEIVSLQLNINLRTVIGSVTNKKRMKEVCKTFSVNTIYHAAAYKHVPLVEENPFEGVSNNIFGTKICLEAAIDSQVETFVLISTDKAVRPTNIMGATKRFSEMILQSYSDNNNENSETRMTMVRFGNVLGSSGSAIPLFQKQIKEGGPVTVTDPEVTRYFMSIPEAAELVIQAGALGEGGDVFVLDMGEPVKIVDLAKRLINLSGLDVKDENHPNGDIEIIFTGLRSGEKLYEELLIGDNVSKTEHNQILRAEEEFITKKEIGRLIIELEKAENNNDVDSLKEIFSRVINGYHSKEGIVDVISLNNLKTQ